MRDEFQSFYPPSKEFFDTLWKESIIILDTNVILDMYRYSDSTRRDFFAIFDKVADRLWIPHQVGLEFSRNRPGVISEQVQMFQKAITLIASLRESTAKEIERILSFRLHPVLNKDEFKKAFEDPLTELERKIDDYTKSHPDLFDEDPVLESLLNLLQGRVGPAFDDNRLEEIYKEGKKRYERDLPPGYEDARGPNKKEGNAIYGDLVLWLQIIEHVKVSKVQGVIFVCNDMKEDWWWFSKGRNLGCRPELRNELHAATGAIFHIYTSERFLQFAPDRIEFVVKEESIDEVRTLQEKNREASEKATGAYADSLLKRILEHQANNNNMLSGVQPSSLLSLIEEQRKRQESLNRVLTSNLGQGAFAKFAEQLRKQQEDHQRTLGSPGWLGSLKALEGMTTPSLTSLLGSVQDTEQATDETETVDDSESDSDDVTTSNE